MPALHKHVLGIVRNMTIHHGPELMNSNDQYPRLVVLDWAGTIIDSGSKAPLETFIRLFANEGIDVPENVASEPMGLGKREHIERILANKDVGNAWTKQFGRPHTSTDIDRLYHAYEPIQLEAVRRHGTLVNGACETVAWLRTNGIKVAGTTGYPKVIAQVIWDLAREQGFQLDANICNNEVASGRPTPFMLFRAMELTNVYPATKVLKVGDTVPDIMEGTGGGARAISVLKTGSGWLGESSRASLTAKFMAAGSSAVIESIADLPKWISSHWRT